MVPATVTLYVNPFVCVGKVLFVDASKETGVLRPFAAIDSRASNLELTANLLELYSVKVTY